MRATVEYIQAYTLHACDDGIYTNHATVEYIQAVNIFCVPS